MSWRLMSPTKWMKTSVLEGAQGPVASFANRAAPNLQVGGQGDSRLHVVGLRSWRGVAAGRPFRDRVRRASRGG